MSGSPEKREQLEKLEDQALGEAAAKAVASSPRVGSVFSPGISWSGSSLNFWGSAVHCLQMNS